MKNEDFKNSVKRYFFITLEPVHIGTGDNHLGRVDNSIVREPGSNLPKIPGTSLCGAARSYAAHYYNEINDKNGKNENRKIQKAFGTAADNGGSYAGEISISDARIFLFPVYSLRGPVWVTTPSILKENSDNVFPNDISDNEAVTLLKEEKIIIGWLLFNKKRVDNCKLPEEIPEEINNRIVIVNDKMFSQIVNSNLEVRTSVAINPQTGAAQEGALFTYEAIPRATILWTELVDHNFVRCKGNGDNESTDNVSSIEVVKKGLQMIEYFGVGGMVTRGFGRMRILKKEKENG